ncbi:hypothetical protein [Paractinoplanes aksuensis]|nr:hypothetical protein [Actinoplanes aksuensis]
MKTWTVDDEMTQAVVSVRETAAYRELVDLLIAHRCGVMVTCDGA